MYEILQDQEREAEQRAEEAEWAAFFEASE